MKTQFSKEKWLKKKSQKYLVTFEIRKPTINEICEVYFANKPSHICFLRPDMLGYLMNYSNVSSESNVLIVENTRGLITGAVAEREIKYGLRVEFGTDALKLNNEILRYTYPFITTKHNLKIGAINSNLLIQTDKDKPNPFAA